MSTARTPSVLCAALNGRLYIRVRSHNLMMQKSLSESRQLAMHARAWHFHPLRQN